MTTATAQKIDRGVKRRCPACATLFYDLLHSPIRCPKCGAAVDARAGTQASAAKRFKAATRRTSAKKAAPVEKPKPRKEKPEETERDDRSDQDDLLLDRDDDEE